MTVQWSVPRMWEGQTVVVLASGPSMSQDVADKALASTARVIAINDTFRLAPTADMLYAADGRWWHRNRDALEFAGLKVTASSDFDLPGVYRLQGVTGFKLTGDPSTVVTGRNSTFQAMHVAIHAGAKKILLCGVDMRYVKGKEHWFGNHPQELANNSPYRVFIQHFDRVLPSLRVRGVSVINCTPGSALKCFPVMTIEDALHAHVHNDKRGSAIPPRVVRDWPRGSGTHADQATCASEEFHGGGLEPLRAL